MLVLLVMSALAAAPGCTKDTDCKGERICEAGKCVEPPSRAVAPVPVADAGVAFSEPPLPPPPPPPAPPLAPNPADYPKVTRLNGMTCVETLEGDGTVKKDCRAEGAAYTGAPRNEEDGMPVGVAATKRGDTTEEPSSVVADFAVLGTLGILAARAVGIAGGFGLHLSVGGRLTDFVALGGMLDGQMLLGGGVLLVTTLAPALRLGNAGHATLGLGPSLLFISAPGLGSGVGFAGTFVVHGGIPLAGGFGLHPRFGLTFGMGAVIFTLSFGFGGSVF